MTAYRCILADPPWSERGGGRIKRGADRHYPLMSLDAIRHAITLSAAGPTLASGAPLHWWTWATSNHLGEALELLQDLRLRYVTDWVWVKDRVGLGQYRRSRHEHLLLAVQGNVPLPAKPWPDSVIEWPRTEHSRKPDCVYDLIEHVSPGPRLELFARRRREGWDAWGDEVGP